MSIAVTAATGQLGQLVVQDLLAKGVPAADIVAVVRDPEKAAPLAAQGVTVRQADYNDAAAFAAAFAGVDRVLLISGLDPNRVEQHRAIIAAAKEAGVGLIAYTSVVNGDTSTLMVAKDHLATEKDLRDSGVPFVMLRNSWYMENYTGTLGQALGHGAMVGSSGEGKISAATRADYAEAAAAVLTGDGHENAVYELGGDEPFTMSQLAEEVSQQSGTTVVYRDVPLADFTQMLVSAGRPEIVAKILADSQRGSAANELYTDSGDLSRLIGHPTTTPAEAIAVAVRSLPQH